MFLLFYFSKLLKFDVMYGIIVYIFLFFHAHRRSRCVVAVEGTDVDGLFASWVLYQLYYYNIIILTIILYCNIIILNV